MQHYVAIALQNKTLRVTTVINAPYTMMKTSSASMEGNDQFEGYAVDLVEELSKILHFKYKFKLVSDKAYGIMNEKGEWNGMIGM